MVDLRDLFWLTLTVSLCLLWWNGQKVKEIALQAVRRYCKEMELQLLDENIALRAVWFKRDAQGRLSIWRRYHFEFTSTGDERYSGRVVTLGRQVTGLEVAPHRID